MPAIDIVVQRAPAVPIACRAAALVLLLPPSLRLFRARTPSCSIATALEAQNGERAVEIVEAMAAR